MDKKYKLLVFSSTHHALQTEQALKKEDYSLMMVPVPPEIDSDCGLAVKFSEIEVEDILKIIAENNIEFAGLYQIKETKSNKEIRKIK